MRADVRKASSGSTTAGAAMVRAAAAGPAEEELGETSGYYDGYDEAIGAEEVDAAGDEMD